MLGNYRVASQLVAIGVVASPIVPNVITSIMECGRHVKSNTIDS
jgi:hypothetical protein